jgi:hypothetical protein
MCAARWLVPGACASALPQWCCERSIFMLSLSYLVLLALSCSSLQRALVDPVVPLCVVLCASEERR